MGGGELLIDTLLMIPYVILSLVIHPEYIQLLDLEYRGFSIPAWKSKRGITVRRRIVESNGYSI